MVNVLNLYQKAQSQGLEAQDIAWIDQVAREHPYFGMAHMIAARHHMAEKTTVKDNALMAGATYALDRNLLFNYVQDIMAKPRQAKAQSVVEAKEVVLPAVQQPVSQDPEPDVVPDQPLPDELPGGLPEEMPEPTPAELPTVPETEPDPDFVPDTEPEEEPSEEPEPDNDPEEDPDITPEPAPEPETKQKSFEQPVFSAAMPQVGINWFLNMRLKLRAGKFKGLESKIRASILAHAAAEQQVVSNPASQQQVEAVSVPSQVEMKQVEAIAQSEEPQQETKEEYKIGAFAAFSFVPDRDSEHGDSDAEALVIDPDTMAVEATFEEGEGGEIIFEEEGRILEIVVSPALRERFFKGKMPFELNFSSLEEEIRSDKQGLKDKTPDEKPKLQMHQPEADPQKRRKKASELIDRFIELEPTVSKNSLADVVGQDFSKESSQEPDEWVTETLARIYVQQGNRGKAIKIYQKLGLLFPEKKNYFASRIAELK